MLDVYADFAENFMAMPVIKGEKTEGERFPGAVNTYCIEAMMQDRKALQAGTSHFLGQNFAKAQEIKYLSDQGREEFCWTTSWGVSTRLIGGLLMTHADDDGLVIVPPRLAPAHIVILPVIHKEETKAEVMSYCEKLGGGARRRDVITGGGSWSRSTRARVAAARRRGLGSRRVCRSGWRSGRATCRRTRCSWPGAIAEREGQGERAARRSSSRRWATSWTISRKRCSNAPRSSGPSTRGGSRARTSSTNSSRRRTRRSRRSTAALRSVTGTARRRSRSR